LEADFLRIRIVSLGSTPRRFAQSLSQVPSASTNAQTLPSACHMPMLCCISAVLPADGFPYTMVIRPRPIPPLRSLVKLREARGRSSFFVSWAVLNVFAIRGSSVCRNLFSASLIVTFLVILHYTTQRPALQTQGRPL